MEENIKEFYTKEGKSLNDLVQEWIDENGSYLYCIFSNELIETKYS